MNSMNMPEILLALKDELSGIDWYSAEDDDGKFVGSSVVKTRKEHSCDWCGTSLPPQSIAVSNRTILPEHGWTTDYICPRCILVEVATDHTIKMDDDMRQQAKMLIVVCDMLDGAIKDMSETLEE